MYRGKATLRKGMTKVLVARSNGQLIVIVNSDPWGALELVRMYGDVELNSLPWPAEEVVCFDRLERDVAHKLARTLRSKLNPIWPRLSGDHAAIDVTTGATVETGTLSEIGRNLGIGPSNAVVAKIRGVSSGYAFAGKNP